MVNNECIITIMCHVWSTRKQSYQDPCLQVQWSRVKHTVARLPGLDPASPITMCEDQCSTARRGRVLASTTNLGGDDSNKHAMSCVQPVGLGRRTGWHPSVHTQFKVNIWKWFERTDMVDDQARQFGVCVGGGGDYTRCNKQNRPRSPTRQASQRSANGQIWRTAQRCSRDKTCSFGIWAPVAPWPGKVSQESGSNK